MEVTVKPDSLSSSKTGDDPFDLALRAATLKFRRESGKILPFHSFKVREVSNFSLYSGAYEVTDIYKEVYGIPVDEWKAACVSIIQQLKIELRIEKNIHIRFIEAEYEEFSI